MDARDRQADIDVAVKTRYDAHAKPLSRLPIGAQVRIQDPKSKKWSHVGVIVGLGRYRDYRIKFASGSVLWRNRRFLQPIFNNDDGDVDSTSDANGGTGSLNDDIPDGGSSDAAAPSSDRAASPHGDTRKQSDGRETQTSTHPPQVRRSNRIRKKRATFNCQSLNAYIPYAT